MGQKPLEFYRAFKATRKPHTVPASEIPLRTGSSQISHLNGLGESQGQPDWDAI